MELQKKILDLLLFASILLLLPFASSMVIRDKRQLYREDIPHHRPLSGATYHHHAGFPHPGRFNENQGQVVPPDPNAPPTPGPELHPGDIPDPPALTNLQNNHLDDDNLPDHPHLIQALNPEFQNIGSYFNDLNDNHLHGDGPVSWSHRS